MSAEPTLEELQAKWTQRMLEAEEANEPLYVTSAEYQELKQMESMRLAALSRQDRLREELQRAIYPTLGHFIGTPVVVTG